jgi:hypothetical protein
LKGGAGVAGHPTYSLTTAAIALSASATKSLWLIQPATVDVVLTEISISFNSSSAVTAPQVDLYRTTTVGSPTGTGGTFVRVNDPDGPAATSSALVNLSAEPTTVEILKSWFVQPAGGLFAIQYPLGREPVGAKTNAGRLGLRVITAASVTPSVIGGAEIEE